MKHTNTFENGINKDVNVNLQPPGTYRDLHNGMLISYDGNHYTVQTALGNIVNFSIPPRYNATIGNFDVPPLPIGMISFIDKLVVFSTNDITTTGGYGEIGVVTFDNNGTGTYVPIYNDVNLKFTKQNKIRGFTYAENDKIERVYWFDFLNENRVINIVDPLLTNVASGSLIANTYYMVLGSSNAAAAVEYPPGSGQFYGPGLTNGNIFYSNSGLAYSVADGSPQVFQYINYHLLSFVPDRKLGSIDFVKWLGGASVNCGSKMYFYRMKLSNQGYESTWSYGSAPINLFKTQATNWKDQQGGGANQTIENSGHGIRIQISNIDTTFDAIEVAVADFDQTNNVLTDAKIIASTTVTGSTMTFDHVSEAGLGDLSLNDLTTFPASVLMSKDGCTVKNYITIGNIKERDEISYDATKISISDFVYLTPGDSFGDDPSAIRQGSTFLPSYGISPSTFVVPDGKYVVSGTGASITYNGITYGPGQVAGTVFTGVSGVSNYAVASGTPLVQGCIVINKYTDSGSNPVQKIIPIIDDYWDYKGMAATQYLRQYWTNETYRFAILFYDLKGNPYFARWIADHQIWNTPNVSPPIGITNKGGLVKQRDAHNYSLQINGVKFSNIKISPSLASLISGFSIVRAPRDRQYLGQGLISQIVMNKNGTSCQPVAQCQQSLDIGYVSQGGVSGAYTFVSPDALCQSSVFKQASGSYIEGEAFLGPINVPTPVVPSSTSADQQFTKYYLQNGSFASVPFSLGVTGLTYVNPDSGTTINGVQFWNAFLEPALGAYSATHIAKGGATHVVQTSGKIYYNGTEITNNPNASLKQKPLANYKIPNSNLYGGTSATAIANTPFISTGHFQEINATILSTLPTSGGDYVFNDVEVFGGDSFVGIFDYAKALYDSGASPGSYGYGIFFPVESNVNHYMRQGRTLARNGMQASNPVVGDSGGIWWNYLGVSQLEQFLVNDAYTSDGDVFQYPALPSNFVNTGNFPFRTRWNGPKISGESIDVFRTFPVNQFRDLDGRMGQINNMITKMGRLYAVQDDAVNYLPVLERQLVNGDPGAATQLGVGGVIDRFDVVSSYFGNQHQNSMVETEYGFSWFDMRRRAWVIMTVSGDIQEISATKGLQSFFNRVFEDQNISNNPIYNTDKPLMGIGMHGVYDPQFKTTFLTFKNYKTNLDSTITNYDFTVGYNHTRNVIVGFFDFNPAIWHCHNRYLLSARNAGAAATLVAHTYSLGDEASINGSEYVYTKNIPMTTHNPVQSWELPNFPSSGLWTKMFSENEIFVHWQNSAGICKFYGRVYPHIIEVIITPNVGEPVAVDNLQMKSSIQTNFDTMEFFTDNDSASDINLNLGNKNYRVRDNVWESSVPLGTKGRLADYYLRVKMTLNNFVTNPTIATNIEKVTAFLNSISRIKR